MCRTDNVLWENSLLPRKNEQETWHIGLSVVFESATFDRSTVHSWTKRMTAFETGQVELQRFASLRSYCDSWFPWNAAAWWCHRPRGSTHHNSTTGSQYFNKKRKSYSHHSRFWILEGVRGMGSAEPRSRAENREKSHFFRVFGTFEAEGEAFLSRTVIVNENWLHHFQKESKCNPWKDTILSLPEDTIKKFFVRG